MITLCLNEASAVDFDLNMAEEDPIVNEMTEFDDLRPIDILIGCEEVNGKKRFNPLKFYANASIAARFPLLCKVAKSYYAAILHEATSERSFSDCGRHLGDRNRNMDRNVVCAQVRIAHGERIEKLPTETIMPFYKSKKRKAGSHDDGLADLTDEEDNAPAVVTPGALAMPAGLPAAAP